MTIVQSQLRELIGLADAFVAAFPQAELGHEEGTQAVDDYVRTRTEVFDRMVAAGGPTETDRDLVVLLLSRDDEIREMLSSGTLQARSTIDRLRTGRRALRGYRTATGALGPVSVKG